ncbi:MAG TPA: hypothetical protein VK558_05135 [Patescibacteria group bacterium]|nr:hypothetical protein [Patescibacteria group bacterium]
MTINLKGELSALCRQLSQTEQRSLDKYGLTTTKTTCAPGCGVMVGKIETAGQYFDFDPDGKKTLILATDTIMTDGGAEPVDLIAFDPAKPDTWWLRLGVADMAGTYQVDRRIAAGLGGAPFCAPVTMDGGYTDEPLHLYRNPLTWLQAGCIGSVMLTPAAADDLRRIGTSIICEGLALAEQVEGLMRLPSWPSPTIAVAAPQHRRVAA